MKRLVSFCFVVCLCNSVSAQSVPSLINYQGRLTDQTGAAMPPGAYIIQFRIWNDPVASTNLIWGQQQNLTVQSNGVFDVILGSPGGVPITSPAPQVNNLAYAFASPSCFMGVTVSEGPSGVIANPTEISPRQQLLSAPFAIQAQQAALAASVAPGSIINTSLAVGAVQTTNIAPGTVTLAQLAPRQIGTNVGIGGMAVSLPSGAQSYNGATFQNIANMSVTIQTTGRPVLAFLGPPVTNTVSTPSGTPSSFMQFIPNVNYFILQLVRDAGQADQAVIAVQIGTGSGAQAAVGYPTPFMVMDFNPPPGQHTYQLQWGSPTGTGSGYLQIFNMVLIVFEQ
jgi:hypothetical protein